MNKLLTKENIIFSLAVVAVFVGLALAPHLAMLGLALIGLGALALAYFILKNPYLGLLLIVFFLPFERFPTYNLGGIDVKINLIFGLITLLSWLILTLFDSSRQKIQSYAIAAPLGLFFIAILVSLSQALDLSRALQVLAFILFVVALSVATVNLVTTEDRLKKIVQLIFISTGLVGLFGLFQFVGDKLGLPQSITVLKSGYTSAIFGFPRIQAFSMEPLYFGNLLIIPISLGLAYLLDKVNLIKRRWLIVILVLLAIDLLFTMARGAFVGLAFSLLVFVIFYFKRIFTAKNTVIILGIIAIISLVGYFISVGNYGAPSKFVQHITFQDAVGSESVFGRLDSIHFALGIYSRFPTLGVGIGNYGPYMANFPAQAPDGGWGIVNNEYTEVLAETGLVGLIAFLLVIITIIWRSIIAFTRAKEPFLRASLLGLFAAFVGVIVQYNFFSTLYIIHIWVLIGLLLAVQNLILRREKS